MKSFKIQILVISVLATAASLLVFVPGVRAQDANTLTAQSTARCVKNGGVYNTDESKCQFQCGAGSDRTFVEFNFGCVGRAVEAQGKQLNPIIDLLFSAMRALSVGVGIILVLVVVIAGVRYSTAQGDPQKSAGAKKMITGALMGLLVYAFAFSLIQWLVPGGVFNDTNQLISQPSSSPSSPMDCRVVGNGHVKVC
ncbi:MAG TPA: hypothetical protein VLF87_02460 [Patescibacteria group bacterium]|nr:hypothetical protein [Candidatus Saccharimonadales bacterium]HSX46825.1 hypothetical protein [Patescibacteria group bacterium]